MAKIDIGDDLVSLIRSMNPKERRYFKLQAQAHGRQTDKLYLRLFDFLHTQAEWSESAVREAFKAEGFLNQLNVACDYLYRKLLAVLRDYDKAKLVPLEASRRLDELSVLFERGLYPQCMRQVRLALRYATRMELPHLQLLARQWEVRLLRRQGKEGHWTRMQEAIQAGRLAAQQVDLENALQGLFSQVYAANGWSTKLLPNSSAGLLATLGTDPLLDLDPVTLPFDAAILLHSLHSNLAFFQSDRVAYALANKQKMAVWERNKWRRESEPERYFLSQYNFAESAIEAGMAHEVGPVIGKMERLVQSHKALAASQGSALLQLKLHHRLNLHDFEGTRAMQEEVEATLKQLPGQTPPFFVEICANMAYAHFYCRDWPGCLGWLDRAEPSVKKGARTAFNLKVGPIRLMALYETLDLDRLEQTLSAWQATPGNNPLSESVGHAFQTLTTANSEAEESSALRRLCADLRALQAEPELRELITTWAEARLRGRN